MNKKYNVGDIYGYDYYIREIPFNPDFPGKVPSPRIGYETYMMGKQTFYCLVIKGVWIEGLLTTDGKTYIPMIQTWDGWVPLEKDAAPYETREKAIEVGTNELREKFRKGEFVDWLTK
jgi:hypothetical protein